MTSSRELCNLLFSDLKKYNERNFKTIENADLSQDSPIVHKSFSSVVTRFFIFAEKHPEVSDTEMKMLYYMLNIDRIAKYFSEYPTPSLEDLRPFQSELQSYVKSKRGEISDGIEERSTSL